MRKVEDGVVTLVVGGVEMDRHIHRMTSEQAIGIARLGNAPKDRRTLAAFLIAEGGDLARARKAVAAAGEGPAVAALRRRLDRAAGTVALAPGQPDKAGEWRSLFDGKTLAGWSVLPGVDPRWVGVGKGMIGFYEHGVAGIVRDGAFPTDDYEVVVEVQPVRGGDQFCEMVFPVGASHCYLGVGAWAWAGGKIALDSVDGRTGNQNVTTRPFPVEQNRWYEVRLQVTPSAVAVWVDGIEQIRLPREGHTLACSPGLLAALKPLGIYTWRTQVAFRNIRLCRLGTEAGPWRSLFDGESSKNWKPVPKEGSFARAGEVSLKDGAIVMGPGNPHTGVVWAGPLRKGSYELTYEAMKLAGPYQFGCVAFPVGESLCALELGGGARHNIVGLSGVDGKPFTSNLTTQRIGFQHNRWYRLRVRVSDEKVEIWLDDRQIVDLPRAAHTFTATLPGGARSFAFYGYGNTSAVRSIRARSLGPLAA